MRNSYPAIQITYSAYRRRHICCCAVIQSTDITYNQIGKGVFVSVIYISGNLHLDVFLFENLLCASVVSRWRVTFGLLNLFAM